MIRTKLVYTLLSMTHVKDSRINNVPMNKMCPLGTCYNSTESAEVDSTLPRYSKSSCIQNYTWTWAWCLPVHWCCPEGSVGSWPGPESLDATPPPSQLSSYRLLQWPPANRISCSYFSPRSYTAHCKRRLGLWASPLLVISRTAPARWWQCAWWCTETSVMLRVMYTQVMKCCGFLYLLCSTTINKQMLMTALEMYSVKTHYFFISSQ